MKCKCLCVTFKCRILPCKRFLCCCRLSKGIKCVIIIYTLAFLVFLGSLIWQISMVHTDSMNCSSVMGHVQSAMCTIFGNRSFMVIAYPLFITTLYGLTSGFGIYVWCGQFQIFAVEKYFYILFVIMGSENINSAIASIAVNDENMGLVLIMITIEVFIHAYLIGIVYSFLLETDLKYRIKRREEAKNETDKTPEVTEVTLIESPQTAINSEPQQE
ncbi:unnamed protein product [Moneuplotes crassus]|uniref:Uncharacterized protein n=1 Tax=Euplotes crassus TaxID=5936 RepID=A0AAD1XYN7_EUPCR|nr:unnamed protein product [Moneuplotes crassus]